MILCVCVSSTESERGEGRAFVCVILSTTYFSPLCASLTCTCKWIMQIKC